MKPAVHSVRIRLTQLFNEIADETSYRRQGRSENRIDADDVKDQIGLKLRRSGAVVHVISKFGDQMVTVENGSRKGQEAGGLSRCFSRV